jgi:hypothetical protein
MAGKTIPISKEDKKSLYKRYLFWLYKTTKDELDKIDRKFTQLEVDKRLEKILMRKAGAWGRRTREGILPFLKEWQEYIFAKESDAQKLRFSEDGHVNPGYLFLCLKLEAIKDIIKATAGKKGLLEFKRLYEESAMKRISEDITGKR